LRSKRRRDSTAVAVRMVLPSKTHCQNPPVILQSKMPAPFPRGPYADCAAHLPPSLREVAFAKQKTEGVSFLTNATPPVTAYAATAPSERGAKSACIPLQLRSASHCPSPPVRLEANHLPLQVRGGFSILHRSKNAVPEYGKNHDFRRLRDYACSRRTLVCCSGEDRAMFGVPQDAAGHQSQVQMQPLLSQLQLQLPELEPEPLPEQVVL